MGVIYAALDPALGRKVAVKLLRAEHSDHDSQGRARLLREAQALARLSHPSVIHVYEAGTFDAQVYIAMEFVEGTTLRAWQAQPERSWRAVLHAYASAIEGLAAAHRAGIIHRDFKPDNVLVAPDDSVRVIDFGLARAPDDGSARDGPSPDADLSEALTRTGTLMGTPAYMAPEQFARGRVDARTDQFAVCVALYEALYGYRPFAGSAVATLAESVSTGRIEPPPRYTDVPEAIYRALRTGLAVDPRERHVDLGALLTALRRRPRSWRRWITPAIALALLGGATASGLALRNASVAQTEGAQALERRFEHARAEKLERTLLSATKQSAGRAWAELVLAEAQRHLARDPARSLAWIQRLRPGASPMCEPDDCSAAPLRREQLTAARLLASAALQRPFIVASHPTKPLEVEHLSVSEGGMVGVAGGPSVSILARDGSTLALHGLRGNVRGLVLDRQGQTAVAGDDTGVVQRWQLQTPTAQATSGAVLALRSPVVALAGDADLSHVAIATEAGELSMWEGEGNRLLRRGMRGTTALAISREGKWVAHADADGQVVLLRPDAPHEDGPLDGAGVARGLRFDATGTHLDVLDRSGKARTFDLDHRAIGTVMTPWTTHAKTLVGRGREHVVWMDAKGLRYESHGHATTLVATPPRAAALDVEGRWLAVVDARGRLDVWRLPTVDRARLSVRDDLVSTLAASSDGQTIAYGTVNGAVRLWSPTTDEVEPLGHLFGGVHMLEFSPSGKMLAATGGLTSLTLWPLSPHHAPPLTLATAHGSSPPAAWSPNERHIAAAVCRTHSDCALAVFHVESRTAVANTAFGPRFESVTFDASSTFVLARRSDASVTLLEVGGGVELQPSLETPADEPVIAQAFGALSGTVNLVTSDGQHLHLWIWDPQTAVIVRALERRVDAAVSDATGRHVWARHGDARFLWDVAEATWTPIAEHSPQPTSFRRHGSLILAGEPPAITVLHPETGASRRLDVTERGWVHIALDQIAWIDERRDLRLGPPPPPGDTAAFFAWLTSKIAPPTGTF